MSRQLQGRFGPNVNDASLYENEGLEVFGVKSALEQQLSPGSRLRGGEPSHVVALVGKNKTDSATAQIAHPIKNGNWCCVHRHVCSVTTYR